MTTFAPSVQPARSSWLPANDELAKTIVSLIDDGPAQPTPAPGPLLWTIVLNRKVAAEPLAKRTGPLNAMRLSSTVRWSGARSSGPGLLWIRLRWRTTVPVCGIDETTVTLPAWPPLISFPMSVASPPLIQTAAPAVSCSRQSSTTTLFPLAQPTMGLVPLSPGPARSRPDSVRVWPATAFPRKKMGEVLAKRAAGVAAAPGPTTLTSAGQLASTVSVP